MKNATLLFLILLIPTIAGCKAWDQVGKALFNEQVKRGTITISKTNIVDQLNQLPDGSTHTNKLVEITQETIPTWTTNYIVKPTIETGVNLAGDLAPFPWAGAAASGVLSLLSGLAALYGRKYRKAAVSAVQSADQWRQIVKKMDGDTDKEIKAQVVKNQRSSGTQGTIDSIIQKYLK